ncbi:uncharacterized protein SPPG_02816 [Spizellomyces punctatus DAOM BR117]|uniref:nicotinamidase n=1 Tax=Spizellomyces punctatus (strain DAOM BR117) TaxID=645134 RepID=A0A0L0HNE5_SPIPD|nr:uncharacterized protein SPPG_02816 [Spizellomyces punctatus DAOM BR117]KND02344.1 hypothetical protein SPPG_02816 [Spizellomyces punctatus DAOM BR117]|eukprot:XP_016610383.1 hypothetical protein SPPG_02816 [Spizellomyces punctatus DAOM BR117]
MKGHFVYVWSLLAVAGLYNLICCLLFRLSETEKIALIVVDVQNDFLPPSGALPVPGGREIVPVVERLLERCEWDLVVATQDWHPPNHASFASRWGVEPMSVVEYDYMGRRIDQIAWPDHCLVETPGAALAFRSAAGTIDHYVRKGIITDLDAYSAFAYRDYIAYTDLARKLWEKRISHAYVVGLAADVCVVSTAIDSIAFGFHTTVITNATRAIRGKEGMEDMRRRIEAFGGRVASLEDEQFRRFCPRY